MNVLDENIVDSQRHLLRGWRISVYQIGYELSVKGTKDDNIIPYLRSLRRPTFFTRDGDFYERHLCHSAYCLVHLAVGQYEAATFIRRVLKHEQFNTRAKRIGNVIRASHVGLRIWRRHAEIEEYLSWGDTGQ